MYNDNVKEGVERRAWNTVFLEHILKRACGQFWL